MDCRKENTLICCCIFLLFASGDCLNWNDGQYSDPSANLETWIGIALGTDYCSVSVFEHGKVKILLNEQGNLRTPSCVAFTDNSGEVLIGEATKNQSHLNPERTICDATRLIGTTFDDPEVQRVIKASPYEIIDKQGKPYIQVKKMRDYSPEEITTMLLRRMKEQAEAYLGWKIHRSVCESTVNIVHKKQQNRRTKSSSARTEEEDWSDFILALTNYKTDELASQRICNEEVAGILYELGL